MDWLKIVLIALATFYCTQRVVGAARPDPTRVHTQIYNDWKAGNFNATLFLPNTYLPQSFYLDYRWGCTTLTETEDNTIRSQYLAYLSQNQISCAGTWCQNQSFRCLPRGTLDCYQVEHIIDQTTNDPELDRYEKNILGNLIMAYGRWNNQVGQLAWSHVEVEKSEVYGSLIFETAKAYVIQCGENRIESTGTADDADDTDDVVDMESTSTVSWSTSWTTSDIVGMVFGGIFMTMCLAGTLIIVKLDRERNQDLQQDQVESFELVENEDPDDLEQACQRSENSTTDQLQA